MGVQREASYLAAHLTYEETAEALQRAYPLTISACQVENLVAPVGQAMQEEEEQDAVSA